MKKVTRQRAALAAVVMIAVLGSTGCDRIRDTYGRRGQDEAAQAVTVYAVNTTTAVKGHIRDYLAISGDIVAASTVDAFSDAAGRVSRLFVSVGSRVRRDDPIAEVDPSRPGMEFVPSLVKAPVAGTIVALPAQLGMTINQAVPLARIAAGEGLEVRLFVAERFISKVALNQRCEIRLGAFPGEVFRGVVTELSPVLDPASRTMEIRVGVENPGGRLRAGMFAMARIITEEKDNIVKIPASAIINRFGEQYVFVIDNSDPDALVARKRNVIPGISIDGVMEIQHGLEPDEEIVIRGQGLIDDGSRVNVIERTTPLSAG